MMKKNLSKVIVPTLAIAIGAAIAGSISGTVAWYQYSTRVNVAYLGTSAGTSGNLFLRIKGTEQWLTNLSHAAIADYLADEGIGQKVQPITSGNMGEDDDLPRVGGTGANANDPKFYKNPSREWEDVNSPYSKWLAADDSMYVTIPLELAYIERDNKAVAANKKDEEFLEKDVYLSDLLIQEDYSNNNNTDPSDDREDLSPAIRVHIHSYRDDDTSTNKSASTINRLISKDGGSILTHGYLDLDGGGLDTIGDGDDRGAMYEFGEDTEVKKVVYGEGTQKSYYVGNDVKDNSYLDKDGENPTAEKVYPTVVKSVLDNNGKKTNVLDENDFEYAKNSSTASKKIGTTVPHVDGGTDTNEGKYLQVEVTIWVEGWQQLKVKGSDPAEYKSMWSVEDYMGSKFDVGFQFAVQAE